MHRVSWVSTKSLATLMVCMCLMSIYMHPVDAGHGPIKKNPVESNAIASPKGRGARVRGRGTHASPRLDVLPMAQSFQERTVQQIGHTTRGAMEMAMKNKNNGPTSQSSDVVARAQKALHSATQSLSESKTLSPRPETVRFTSQFAGCVYASLRKINV